jgi:hypothetical protein
MGCLWDGRGVVSHTRFGLSGFFKIGESNLVGFDSSHMICILHMIRIFTYGTYQSYV